MKQPGRETDALKVLLGLVPIASLVVVVIYLPWAFQRGFDITDEGYALLSAMRPGDNLLPTNGFFHWYTRLLLEASDGSLFGFRVAGLLLVLGSGLFFSVQVMRIVERVTPIRVTAIMRGASVAFMLLATTGYYALALPSPNYNLLNLVGVLVAAGAMLRALGRPEDTEVHRCLWLLIAGLCIGFCTWIKWPTGIAMFIVLVPLAILWAWLPLGDSKRSLRNGVGAALCLIAGGVVGITVNLVVIQSPLETWNQLNGGLGYLLPLGSNHGDGIVRRTIQQLGELKDAFVERYLWGPVVLAVLGVVLAAVAGRTPKAIRRTGGVFVALVLVMIVGTILVGDAVGGVHGHDSLFLNACAWLLFSLIFTAFLLRNGSGELRLLVFPMLLMIAMPFLYAAGTGSPLAMTGSGCTIGLFAATAVLLMIAGSRLEQPLVPTLGLAGMSIVIAASIVTAGGDPYRLAEPIWNQNVPVPIGPEGHEVLLDETTADALLTLRGIADQAGFETGDDVLALMSMPGIVAMLGGRSPATPWFYGGYDGSLASTEIALSSVPVERRRASWLLLSDRSTFDVDEIGSLTGRAFPDGYDYEGQAYWPVNRQMIQLWKPNADESERSPVATTASMESADRIVLKDVSQEAGPFEVGGIYGTFAVEPVADGFRIEAVSRPESGPFVVQLHLDGGVAEVTDRSGPDLLIVEADITGKSSIAYNPTLFIQERIQKDWYRLQSRIPGERSGERHHVMRVVTPNDPEPVIGISWSPAAVGDELVIRNLRTIRTPLSKRIANDSAVIRD